MATILHLKDNKMYHHTYSKDELLKIAGVETGELMAGFDYGSRMYGTDDSELSDFDYIVIVRDGDEDVRQVIHEDVNITVYSESKWKEKTENHDIEVIECNAQYSDHFDGIPGIDLAKLRSSISRTASNSWVKCKKKLTVETDARRVGIKSLFHSFRIPMFGIQVAKFGTITNFYEAKGLWKEMAPLIDSDVSWEEINTLYKKRHNELMSEFRKLAEKA
jgi:hypothetical protein